MRRLILFACTFAPSGIRIWILRRLGFQIGRNCRIGVGAVVVADQIRLGNDVQINSLSIIYNLREFTVGSGSMISYLNIIYSAKGDGYFRVGERFGTGLLAIFDCTGGIQAGDFCGVGPQSFLNTHANHLPTSLGFTNKYSPITLGDRVWLMLGVKVTPGVSIADDVHVAPGTVVARPIKKSGFFLNSYMGETDVLMPIPEMRMRKVDAAFIDAWMDKVFDDLPRYVEAVERRRCVVTRRTDGWELSFDGNTLVVIDGRDKSISHRDNTLYLLYDHRDPVGLPKVNWLDCHSLEYCFVSPIRNWSTLREFFYGTHGMLLAEWEPSKGNG